MTDAELRRHTLAVNDATYAAWNAHDADAVAAVFAEEAVLREAGTGAEHHGRRAIRDRAAALLKAFPDFHLEKLVLVMDGPRHADRWVMTGTHRGELFGIEPTGRRVRIEGSTFHDSRRARPRRRRRALHRQRRPRHPTRPRLKNGVRYLSPRAFDLVQ